MAKIPGSLPITGFISTTSTTDTYATHVDEFGKGGYRSVASIEQRDVISEERRSLGMLCYVVSENKTYQLSGGVGNADWREFISALPPLGEFSIAGIKYPEIFAGTASGKAEVSQALGYALLDIGLLNARFLTGNFIMGDATVHMSYPNAQFLVDLDDGLLAKTGKVLKKAEAGIDFIDINIQACFEYAVPVWMADNNKTLTSTHLRVDIQHGDAVDGDDVYGVRNLTLRGAVIARGAITSNESVFALNNVGTREVKIYDRINEGAGRLTRSVNFISAYTLAENVNFYLPETASTLGRVLADVGEAFYDGRIFRRLEFVDIASNAATYILQQPNQSLPNAQALNALGLGLIKTTLNGVLAEAIAGTDYVTIAQLEEETTARIEADGILETAIDTLAVETQVQITAITGFGSTALLTEFLVELGWTEGYAEYLWDKYRPVGTKNSYADTDQDDKVATSTVIRFDADHIGVAGDFKPGIRILSWDSSVVFNNDLFPVSIGLFGYRKQAGVIGAQDGIIWQSYFENNSSSPHYKFPINFGMYHVGHDEGQIGWNRQEILLMEYRYYDDKFAFEKKTEFKDIVKFSASATGMSIGNTAGRPKLVNLYAGLLRINTDITPSSGPKIEFWYPLYPPLEPPSPTNPDGIDDPRNWIISKELESLSLTGAVTGSLINGVIDTVLTPINTSQITNFSNNVSSVAKLISLDQFAIAQSDINLNNKKLYNSSTPSGLIDNEVATVGYVKQNALSRVISLTGAVTGSLVNDIINTTLNSVQNLFTTSLDLTYPEIYGGGYSLLSILPSNDPAPFYQITSQTGSSVGVNPTLRKCSISMYQGTSNIVQNRIDFSIYHSLLSGTRTITALSIGYSGNEGKALVSVFGLLDLGVYNASSSAVPTLPAHLCNKTFVDNKKLNEFGVSADVSLGTYRMSSSTVPTLGDHFCNKTFVDNKKLNEFGVSADVSLGTYRMSSSTVPTLGNHLCNKTFVDNKKLNEFGVSADVSLGTYRMSSSTAPTSGDHFCNKTFVDDNTVSVVAMRTAKVMVGDIGGGSSTVLIFSGGITGVSKTNGYTGGDSFINITFADRGYVPLIMLSIKNNLGNSYSNDLSLPVILLSTNTTARILLEETNSVIQSVDLGILLIQPNLS